ncbi:hypothetical protein [Bdellovibrio bacteriovorus]|uniref:hypothetical protein n=1 Tax=Bdellovibrio bacteriovorus TaxID=959 RepID=UPI0035A70616
MLFALTLLVLPSCQTVTVPNTRVVAVAGELKAGAIWSETLSPKTGDMTLDEFIDFLEPQEEIRTSTGKVIQPAKGAAFCQSAEDWNKQKTALEKACRKLGKACSYEIKKTLEEVSQNLEELQLKAIKKY